MRLIVLTLFFCFLAAAQWVDCPSGTQADCAGAYSTCISTAAQNNPGSPGCPVNGPATLAECEVQCSAEYSSELQGAEAVQNCQNQQASCNQNNSDYGACYSAWVQFGLCYSEIPYYLNGSELYWYLEALCEDEAQQMYDSDAQEYSQMCNDAYDTANAAERQSAQAYGTEEDQCNNLCIANFPGS
jgi:hypothetical protein